jgi:hypothetical protein
MRAARCGSRHFYISLMRHNAEPSGFPTASPAHHACWTRKEAAMAITDETAMIAVRPTSSDLLRGQAPRLSPAAMAAESARTGILPVEAPPTITAQFRPLDPGIVNEAIPAFFIGRNREGFWIARDVKGRIGGIFLLESSALSFARKNSRPAGCATIFPSERFELDLENNGNPIVAHLRSLMRLATTQRRRAAASIRKMAQAISRRS